MIDLYPVINSNRDRLSKEEKLIFSCATLNADKDNIKESSRLDLNWKDISNRVASYKLGPLLYRQLHDSEGIPQSVKQALREDTALVFAKNILLLQELESLIEKFRQGGIEIIILKGAALAYEVYGDIALRGFDDIDILIKRKDRDKIFSILRKCGYSISQKERLDFSLKYRSQVLFAKDSKFFIDLHWNLMDLERYNKVTNIDLDRIWNNKQPLDIKGISSYQLSLNDTIIYQCLHLAIQHAFKGLLMCVDINELISKYKGKINWDSLIEDVAYYRVKKPVFYAFLFTKRMFNSDIPQWVLDRLKPKMSSLEEKIIFKKLKSANMDKNIEYILTPLLLDSWPQRLKFIFFDSLRSPKYFFYSLKLIFKSIALAIKMLLKNKERVSSI